MAKEPRSNARETTRSMIPHGILLVLERQGECREHRFTALPAVSPFLHLVVTTLCAVRAMIHRSLHMVSHHASGMMLGSG